LQEHADQRGSGVCLKVRHDDTGRFPGARPVWFLNAEWDPEGTDGAKSGIEEECIDYGQHSEMRAGVAESGWGSVWLRVHDFLALITWLNIASALGARTVYHENHSITE
jgi:hypothetical protein